PPTTLFETGRQGLQALSVLYRLTDLYLPDQEDGRYLRRAARDLLLEFVRLAEKTHLLDDLKAGARQRFDKQLAWLHAVPKHPTRVTPELPAKAPAYE